MYNFMGLGGKTFWFFGVVEDVNDPLQIGRAKVRAHALHGPSSVINTEDLPWSTVLLPTTAGGGQGTRISPGLDVGATVMGFFIDGASGQYPIIVGILPGMNGELDLTAPGSDTLNQNRPNDGSGNSSIPDGSSIPSPPSTDGAVDLKDLLKNIQKPARRNVVNDPCLALSYFEKELGLSRGQSAALVGNLCHESNLSTTIDNPGDAKDGTASVGIAQWNMERLTRLYSFANRLQKPWSSYDAQLAFVVWEMQNTHVSAYNALKAINVTTATKPPQRGGSLFQAVEVVRNKYEVAEDHIDRYNWAYGIMTGCPIIGGNSSSGTSRF